MTIDTPFIVAVLVLVAFAIAYVVIRRRDTGYLRGKNLDTVASMWGFERLPRESDRAFRERIVTHFRGEP